ncbi:hypothetical protein KEM48_010968, partial [Puccinia striiformis f. sp. tritici PST-130]
DGWVWRQRAATEVRQRVVKEARPEPPPCLVTGTAPELASWAAPWLATWATRELAPGSPPGQYQSSPPGRHQSSPPVCHQGSAPVRHRGTPLAVTWGGLRAVTRPRSRVAPWARDLRVMRAASCVSLSLATEARPELEV